MFETILPESLACVLTRTAARAFVMGPAPVDVLAAMLREKQGDAAAILGADRVRCLYELGAFHDRSPLRYSREPSPLLTEWVESTRRTWVEQGHPLIRTGMLMHTLVASSSRYLGGMVPVLSRIDPSELAQRIESGLAPSDEVLEAYRPPAPIPPPIPIAVPLSSLEGFQHFRIEITSYSGSVACTQTALFGALDEVQRELLATFTARFEIDETPRTHAYGWGVVWDNGWHEAEWSVARPDR